MNLNWEYYKAQARVALLLRVLKEGRTSKERSFARIGW
jgi:hypothetical protein